jgi:hypothetical protein
MLVKVVANTQFGHGLRIGSIASVVRTRYGESIGWVFDCVGMSKWAAAHRPLWQIISNRDVRRIPHNKANLRAFAKQQGHQYKKR